MWQKIIEYLNSSGDRFSGALADHLYISAVSLAVALAIGLSAGSLCAKFKVSQKIIVPVFNVLRVIPGLAILFLLFPVMGLGKAPAIVALTILAVPPILINTATGLAGVSPMVIESAQGLGMTGWQIWLKVKFPLALPMILTGIKTAAIEILASATLAYQIGGGGMGEIIFTAIGLNRYDILIAGSGAVAALSLLANAIFKILETFLFRYKKRT